MTENDNQKLDLIIKMIEQVEKRLDQHDRRFDQIEQVRKEDRTEWRHAREEDRAEWRNAREEDRTEWRRGFDEIKYDLRLDKEKLEKVYEARNQVTVNFSRAFATTNAFIAGVIAVIVSLFMNVDK